MPPVGPLSTLSSRSPAGVLSRASGAARVIARVLCFALVAALLSGATPPARADLFEPSLSDTTKTDVQQILNALATKSSSSDPRYLQNNVWIDGTPTCFRCTLGPSVLAAARGNDTFFDDTLTKLSVATLDKAIHDHQRPDGAYVPVGNGESGPDIQTVMFANELAWTYLILGGRLDMAHRMTWSSSLAKSADWLIRNGDLSYYTNGNINLAIAMNMDLTYRITNLSRFQTAAATSYDFLLNPPQKRWAGFGLQYTKKPTQSDGSDGAAYFAESGGGKPGFDPAYTLFQIDMTSMWYTVTNDDRIKRLTNLLFNQLAPRVRTSDWTIDVGGGTRRSTKGVRYAFTVSALPVLALKGGRTDLQGLVKSQVLASLASYKMGTLYSSPGMSYNYGIEGAATYLAVTTTFGW